MPINTQRQRANPTLWARALALALALFAPLILFIEVHAAADPTPFPPNPGFSAELTARIAAYNNAVQSLAVKRADFDTHLSDHRRRYSEHERNVARYSTQYPNGAPPEIAGPLNAEAATGNAELAQLHTEETQLNAESARLQTERASITTAARMAINAAQPGNQYQRTPPSPQQFVQQPQSRGGGNPVHPTAPSTPAPNPPELRPTTVTGPNGEALPGPPPGVKGTLTRNGKGYIYPLPPTVGIDRRVEFIRVMNPSTTPNGHSYPNGYVTYYNNGNQPVNPLDGRTIPPSDPFRHIPL